MQITQNVPTHETVLFALRPVAAVLHNAVGSAGFPEGKTTCVGNGGGVLTFQLVHECVDVGWTAGGRATLRFLLQRVRRARYLQKDRSHNAGGRGGRGFSTTARLKHEPYRTGGGLTKVRANVGGMHGSGRGVEKDSFSETLVEAPKKI